MHVSTCQLRGNSRWWHKRIKVVWYSVMNWDVFIASQDSSTLPQDVWNTHQACMLLAQVLWRCLRFGQFVPDRAADSYLQDRARYVNVHFNVNSYKWNWTWLLGCNMLKLDIWGEYEVFTESNVPYKVFKQFSREKHYNFWQSKIVKLSP